MLPLLPLPKPRRHGLSRKALLTGYVPPTPPPVGVLVQSVTLYNEEYLLWTFTANIAAVTQDPAALEASPDGVTFDSSQGWELVGANELLLWYKNIALGPGTTYRVLTPPAGLTFSGGASLALPQSGTIIP